MDYSTVTEIPGGHIRAEALGEMYTRYAHAKARAIGKDVLEVGCGPGQGLGFLAASARRVVGGDYSASLVSSAHAQYNGRIPVVRLDAHRLPFHDASFDVILLYEAVYYLQRAREFFDEGRRLLRAGGTVIVCTTNRESPGFNPSPFSTEYLSANQLQIALQEARFDVDLFGAFPVKVQSWQTRMTLLVRRAAVALGLVPRTMRGKELLKKLFYGRLVQVPPSLTEVTHAIEPLVPIEKDSTAAQFRVVYAFARRC